MPGIHCQPRRSPLDRRPRRWRGSLCVPVATWSADRGMSPARGQRLVGPPLALAHPQWCIACFATPGGSQRAWAVLDWGWFAHKPGSAGRRPHLFALRAARALNTSCSALPRSSARWRGAPVRNCPVMLARPLLRRCPAPVSCAHWPRRHCHPLPAAPRRCPRRRRQPLILLRRQQPPSPAPLLPAATAASRLATPRGRWSRSWWQRGKPPARTRRPPMLLPLRRQRRVTARPPPPLRPPASACGACWTLRAPRQDPWRCRSRHWQSPLASRWSSRTPSVRGAGWRGGSKPAGCMLTAAGWGGRLLRCRRRRPCRATVAQQVPHCLRARALVPRARTRRLQARSSTSP